MVTSGEAERREMNEQKKEQKMQYMERVLTQLVERIEALREEAAGPACYGKDISADHVYDQLDALLQVDTPDGETGTLTVGETGLSTVLSTRITGVRVISTRPGDFNGVVWNEEMDRPPREAG
jgi:hypothetical protein